MHSTSRRNVLQAIFAGGATSAVGVTSNDADAALVCGDIRTALGPMYVCTSGLPSAVVHQNAVGQRQQQSNWCWAACIAMVFDYNGHAVSQARIVKEAYGDIVNMPASTDTILRKLNRSWVDDDGDDFAVRSGRGRTTPQAAAHDLAANYPLIIGTRNHAVVLTSLTYGSPYIRTPSGWRRGPVRILEAVVRDPWPSSPSRRVLTPAEWAGVRFAARIRVW